MHLFATSMTDDLTCAGGWRKNEEHPKCFRGVGVGAEETMQVFRKEPGLYDRLKERRTKLGTRLARCIKDCFDTFSEIFDAPWSFLGYMAYSLQDEMGLPPSSSLHLKEQGKFRIWPGELSSRMGVEVDWLGQEPEALSRADTGRVDPKRLDPTGHTIHSVEVSAVRNLRGFRFPAAMDAAERAEAQYEQKVPLSVEMLVAKAIRGLAPAVTGGMDEFEEARLQAAGLHFGLPEDAAALALAVGLNDAGGLGIGLSFKVFASADRDLAVWTNRQEHLTIVSVATGDGLGKAYRKLVRALDGLAQIIQRGKPGAEEVIDMWIRWLQSLAEDFQHLMFESAAVSTVDVQYRAVLRAFATSERLGFLTSDLHRLPSKQRRRQLEALFNGAQVEAVSTLASGKEVEGYFRISNMDVFNATDEEILSLLSVRKSTLRLVNTAYLSGPGLARHCPSLSVAEWKAQAFANLSLLREVFSGVMTASGTDGEELTQEMLAAMMREATPQDASRPGHVEEEELGSLKDRYDLLLIRLMPPNVFDLLALVV
ncbi:Taurocyamine kinase [Symbiodinium microadriaticum]|uniref:Taurocyamine kinase n=1 Tax=Symbiodinium microadriaticum TaxID=2951 RepID=A0A1Q9DXF4_SYMMI|nr:Taurocyamine kinase [Symbiodinium microadriaticum]